MMPPYSGPPWKRPTGHVYQKVDGGRWFMAATILGKQFNCSTKTMIRQEAEAFLAGFIEDFMLTNLWYPPPVGRTWGEMVGSWERTAYARVGKKHRLKVVSFNRRYLASMQDKKLDEIMRADLEVCLQRYIERNPITDLTGFFSVISLLAHWADSRRFFST